MQSFFDKMDAGQYDARLIVVIGLVFVLVCVWSWSVRRAAGRMFIKERARAHHAWEQYGSDHHATQLAVIDALAAWAAWQRRSPYSLDPDNPGARKEDWDAISLIRCLPSGALQV